MPPAARGVRVALAAALACVPVACGDDPTGPRPTELVIEPAAVTIRQRESQHLLVSVTDQDGVLISGVAVTFTASDANVVTVSNLGDVTSVGPRGTASVKVKAGGLVKDVPVVVEGVPGSVVVTPSPVVLPQKGTLPLQAKVLDVAGAELPGQSFTFQSTDPALVTVDGAGVLTSVGPHGVAKVDLRSGELRTTIDVAVTQVPTTLQVTPNPLALATGQSAKLRVRTLDAIGVDVATTEPPRFESSNASIVTVDAEGIVRSVGPVGQATVTVRGGTLSQAVPVTVSAVSHPVGEVNGTIALVGAFGVAFARSGEAYAVSMSTGVHRLDLEAKTATVLTSATNGLDLAIPAAGGRAYVASQLRRRIDLVDLATGAVITSSPELTDAALTDLLSPDDRTLWVGAGNGVVVLDATTLTVQKSLPLGTVVHMARHPSQPYVYASGNGGAVSEIDAGTLTVRRTFNLSGKLQGVVVSPDGAELYVLDEYGPLNVVDLATGTRVAQINIGVSAPGGGYGLALSPDGARLWATMPSGSRLVEVDRATRAVLKTLTLSGTPRRLAFSPRGDVLLVATEYTGGVTIVR